MKNYEVSFPPRSVWEEPDGTRTINIWENVAPITAKLQAQVDNDEWLRASGESVCSCGKKFSKHPSIQGYDWLNVLCDGTLVKL
jgi:hypothetical protein